MRLITYTAGNLYARLSLMRLAYTSHLDIKTIDDFFQGVSSLTVNDAKSILQADKCISFIEGVKKYRIAIDTEDIIITLVTLFSHNMMEESVLKSDFPKEMTGLKRILEENVTNDLPVFQAAKNVLDFILFSRIVKNHALAIVYLISNLMIVHAGKLLVLEDTDSVSPDILLEISTIIEDQCSS